VSKSDAAKERSRLFRDLRGLIAGEAATPAQRPRPKPKTESVDKKIEEARELRIRNNNTEEDQRLKKDTLKKLFWFLMVETGIVFVMAFLQGFKIFQLEEWSFRLLLSATLLQITAMLTIAVRHLFPNKKQ
jgi:hypothetical protein